jgi:predicted nucleotidyltransferase
MNSDFRELLQSFARHKVKYLIVGDYAVIHYSQPRYTKDLDLWLEPSAENASKVARSFADFGIPLIEVTEEDLATEGTQFVLGVAPVMLDFLTSIPPLCFADCWKRRNVVISGNDVHLYLSLEDLCIAKKHAARWQDLADMEELSRVRTNRMDNDSDDSK